MKPFYLKIKFIFLLVIIKYNVSVFYTHIVHCIFNKNIITIKYILKYAKKWFCFY